MAKTTSWLRRIRNSDSNRSSSIETYKKEQMFSICMYRCWIRFCCIIVMLLLCISWPFVFNFCAHTKLSSSVSLTLIIGRSNVGCKMLNVRALILCASFTYIQQKSKTYRYFAVFARCLHTIKKHFYLFFGCLFFFLSVHTYCLVHILQRPMHNPAMSLSLSLFACARAEKESWVFEANEMKIFVLWADFRMCIALLRGNCANQRERQQFLHSARFCFWFFLSHFNFHRRDSMADCHI